MNSKHLEILTEVLAALRPLHTRVDSVRDELERAYYDQSGEWRFSTEGDMAGEEMIMIEDIGRGLEGAIEELRQFVFLLSGESRLRNDDERARPDLGSIA